MRKITKVALATALAVSASSAHAFDGERRGFMIGVAGGVHTTDIDAKVDGAPGGSGSESGLQFRLSIGAGISDHVTIYGMYDLEQDGDAVYGLLGPGATFYFSGSGPSAYLFGGVGVGVITIDNNDRNDSNFRDDYDSATGSGLVFGGGYSITQNFYVDGSLMYLDITDDENFITDIDYEITSLRVSLGYNWF
ncbi:outer membrane beta-barrel protein [Granulosicoccus antarcticus]|uniref:Outer membrane protein beta-barrel domain-containing protein n=1 Tax=Granulosicoccus antarcticus IMCC3135 TaxID=1192854 RepID=A0A2Z2NWP2_9GAMM|nr:outer membrane beta-barrel protein [Granulosicoccus antarcticus]ASJ73260.1 hypothetical protein IMCC3135_15890 [Granulosicoccus antarcticus IMCC3135]